MDYIEDNDKNWSGEFRQKVLDETQELVYNAIGQIHQNYFM